MSSEVINLGYECRKWQREVHIGLEGKRFGVLVVHRRSGKTVLAVMHLIDRACKLLLPDGRYAYIAPQLKQAKAIAWHYLKRYATKIPGTKVNEGELHVTLPNGAQIRIHGGDQPDSLRGLYLDGVVLDEAADLKPDLWDSVLLPLLADRQGWALFLGTPKGQNLLSDKYFAAITLEHWYRAIFTVDQTDAIPATELEMLKREMPVQKYRREMLCDFNASVDDILLSIEQVHAASRRSYMLGDFQHAARVIGVDVARQGGDFTSIIRRQGLMSWAPRKLSGADAMQVADQVAADILEWNPDAVFIDGTGGYGAGVIDRLRQLGHRIIEVQFAEKASKEEFLNKRMEMWWNMAEWIRQAGQIAAEPQLMADLCTPTYGFTPANKMVLESKDDIKARGRPSPDDGDALACTFYSPVVPKSLADALPAYDYSRTQKKFNPLGRVVTYR